MVNEMRPTLLAVALTALLLGAPALAAERMPIALLPTTGSNVSDGTLAAAGDVLRAHLESTGRFEIVRTPGTESGVEATSADAAAAARGQRASLGVTLHVSRLADRAIARLAAYSPDGALVHSDQLPALGADDLDPVLRRLAEGLATGRRGRDLAQIDSVTHAEELPLAKRASYQAFGLRIGALLPMRRPGAERFGGPGGLGLVWHYDAREFLAEVAFEGYTSNLDAWRPDRDRALTFGVGVFRPLSKGDVAPYVGGGLHYAITRFDGETGNGLQPRVAAGLMLGRLSDVAVRVEVGGFWNLFPIRDAAGDDIRASGATVSLTLIASEAARRR
jgi:hypothetical protein